MIPTGADVVRNARGTDLFILHINIYFPLPSVQAVLSSVHAVSSEKPSSRGGRVHANMWKALTEAAQALGMLVCYVFHVIIQECSRNAS